MMATNRANSNDFNLMPSGHSIVIGRKHPNPCTPSGPVWLEDSAFSVPAHGCLLVFDFCVFMNLRNSAAPKARPD